MRFAEVDLFGLYIAPIVLILAAGWILLVWLKRMADDYGLSRFVWHQGLFDLAVYAILVSSLVLALANRSG
jgi:protein AaeX